MGGNKLLHRVNVATGGVIQGEGTETSPLVANVDAIASNVFPAFSGNSGKVLRVNANETGTEWAEMASTGLSDDSKIVRYVKDYEDYLAVSELAKKQEIHHSALFQASADISGDFIQVRKSMDGDVVDNTLRKGRTYLRVDLSGVSSSLLQERTVSTSTYVVEKVKFVSRDGSAGSQTYDLLSGREDAHYLFPDSFEKASASQYGFTFKNREPAADAALNEGWPTKEVDVSTLISAYKAELEKEGTYIGKTLWYLADTNVGITNSGPVFKKSGGAWLMGSVYCDPSLKFSESFDENTKFDMVFLYKDSTGSYVETPTPNSTETSTESNNRYGVGNVEATIDITPDPLRLAIQALEGTAMAVSPGKAYSATLTANATITATGGEEGYRQEAFLDVNPGAYSLTPGNGITFVHDITASKVNYCRIVWTGTSARLLVDDVSDSSGESSSSGTTEGTITVSSQTITGTAGTSLSYNLANYVTVSNGQTPTFTLASGQVLPTGLSLSSSGVISGTTNVTGTTTIRVKVSASNCPDVEMTVTFNIAEAIQQGTITVTKTPKISGVVGTAINPYNLSSCVTVSNGKTPSFSWNESYYPKPSWLNLTGAGVLSGTPSYIPEAGRVTVSADNCTSVNLDITWDIINAGTITVGNQTIDGTVGNAVSLNLSSSTTVSNGQTPTFAVKSGNTLPAGIELSSAGVLSGTPTATSSATVVITITARGCPDKEVSITFNITEEQGGETPSDGWPTTITVSDATATMADSSWSNEWNGTYTRTGDTTTALGETIPVWSNGKYYVMGYGTDFDSPISEVEIGFFINKNYPDRRSAYYYRAKSATTWTRGTEADGPGLTMTIAEDPISGGESSSSSSGSEEPTPSDGWPTKIVVSNATSSYGEDVSAFNGDYVRTGETLSILGENVPVWSNGSKYIYGMSSGMGFDLDEPAIALQSTKGQNDTQMSYAYRMKSDASTAWTMADAANAIGMTATITEVFGGEPGGTKEYVYTVTGATDIRAGANGDYYATGEELNGYPVYTNGEYFMYYFTDMWTGWTIGKNTSGGDIYTTGTTDPIGEWTNGGVVVSAYSGSSSGGESSSSSSGSEEPTPSDGWPTTINISNVTFTAAGSGQNASDYEGTYTRTGETLTVLGEAVPIWSNGTMYIYGTSKEMSSDLSEPAIGLFASTGYTDAYGAYIYRKKSATSWIKGDNGIILSDYTVTEDNGGGSGSSDAFPTTFSVTSCTGNDAAKGEYTRTGDTTTVGGTDYPVYSMTQAVLGTTFYIYVCQYRQGSSGAFWSLKDGSYSASDEGYSSLGSVAAGADGLPSSQTWEAASSSATVSWA
jgi:hypothetical protein